MQDKSEEKKTGFQVEDRRFWAKPDGETSPAEPGDRFPSYVEELKARTEAAEQKLQQRLAELDTENQAFRERFRRESERTLDQQKMELVETFLEVLDNFERGLESANQASPESFRDGVQLNTELFRGKLAGLGVEALELTGERYDPEYAEAVSMVAVADPEQDGRIVDIVQGGYRFGERLLRPARVTVGRYSPEA